MYDIVEESYELANENELDKLLQNEEDLFDNFEEEENFFPTVNGIDLLCMGMAKQSKKKRKIRAENCLTCNIVNTDNRNFAKEGSLLFEENCMTCKKDLIECFGGVKKVYYCNNFPDFCNYVVCSSCYDSKNVYTRRKRRNQNLIAV